MGKRTKRLRRVLFGDHPRVLLIFTAPTWLSFVIDLSRRARDMATYEPHGKAFYLGGLLVSAAFWVLPLFLAARLLLVTGARRGAARAAAGALFALLVFPVAACSYGGQTLYYRVFSAYVGRDTLRLGSLLRGSLWAWFFAWGTPAAMTLMLACGATVTLALYLLVKRAAPLAMGAFPALPVLTFVGALICLWTDNVDSRYLQASTPDACFLNGATHMLRAATTGQGRVRQGVTLRAPAPLPPLASLRARPPNVIVILTESVRADAMCSDPPPRCVAPFLDEVASDRIALGTLTSQTPNTFSASMVLWTGLSPNVDFVDAHTAPTLWELARAVGYRTAYVTSQNARYEDLGVFVHRAGIDWLETSTELGGMEHEQLGAPDERAVEHMLRFLRAAPGDLRTPYFAMLHLSNTHHPYRVDPELQPFAPHANDPDEGVDAYHNHYRNSVRMQERLVAGFVRDVRAMPGWDDTVVIFLSDHGEPFGEHGIIHHNHSVFDEELRVPGWLIAGEHAMGERERAAVRSYAGVRTFTSDVSSTIVDLFGLGAARATLPLAFEVRGRSLLQPHDPVRDPTVFLATSTGVWEPNDARFGVMRREKVIVGAVGAPWQCFDLTRDPGEHSALPVASCPGLQEVARGAFPPGVGANP